MQRTPEPELMDAPEQASAYAAVPSSPLPPELRPQQRIRRLS
jgi:hypothetical protein